MNWEADKQLVRGQSKFNLAIGEPELVREVFDTYYPRHYPSDLSYPDTKPSDELMRELRKLHPDSEIVVTVGAKQGVYAAVAALQGKNPGVLTDMAHPTPYWPTYPTVASKNYLHFNKSIDGFTATVLTSPNNPDGKEHTDKCHIWDAVYAHPSYGWSGNVPDNLMSVWSAGKMLGAPGARVGWLVTKDPVLAEHARQYVEQTTSGVATISQFHVAATLRSTEAIRPELFAKAKRDLSINRERFMLYLGKYIKNLGEDRGMFMWFQATDPDKFAEALKKSGVLMVSGKACADDRPGVYRASLGKNTTTHQDAIMALEKELK